MLIRSLSLVHGPTWVVIRKRHTKRENECPSSVLPVQYEIVILLFFSSFIVCVTILICIHRETRKKKKSHTEQKNSHAVPFVFWYDDDTTVDVILASKKFCVHIKIACVFNVLPTWFSRFLCTICFLVT